MPCLPDFPLEIWLEIFEFACADSGVTSRSLAQSSRYLREASRSFRYQSVATKGWRQLLAFEEQFTTAPFDTRFLTHLYVHLPELYSDAYPPESWFDDEESDMDSSYIPSESEDEDGEESEGEEEDDSSATESVSVDQEEGCSTLQGRPPQVDEDDDARSDSSEEFLDPEEVEEIALDNPDLTLSETEDFDTDAAAITTSEEQREFPVHGQDLCMLKATRLRLAQLEYPVLSALRRILEASAHSLRTFTLCWSPSASVYLEAVIPPLPALRYLAILKDTIPHEDSAPVRYKYHLERARPAPVLFPVLKVLKIGAGSSKKHFAWDDDAFHGLLNAPLNYVAAPSRMIKFLSGLPRTVEEVHAWGPAKRDEAWGRLEVEKVLENLYPFYHSRRSPTASYIRETGISSPDEFKEDWLQQVIGA